MRERAAREIESEREIRPAVAGERVEHARVIGRIDDDEHVAKVLGRGANQTRAADVDLFDQLIKRRVPPRGGARKRIEIDDDKIDWRDLVPAQRVAIAGQMSPRQNAAVNFRMKRLDAAVHHLGHAGDIRNRDDVEA